MSRWSKDAIRHDEPFLGSSLVSVKEHGTIYPDFWIAAGNKLKIYLESVFNPDIIAKFRF